MVARAMSDARAAGRTRFVLHAQAHLADFYASFGFAVSGAQFEEAGIEHVKMTLTVQ
jgi:predicted GNAT family N-acyltransferase